MLVKKKTDKQLIQILRLFKLRKINKIRLILKLNKLIKIRILTKKKLLASKIRKRILIDLKKLIVLLMNQIMQKRKKLHLSK